MRDRRKVQTTAFPHWGLQGTHTTRPWTEFEGCTVSRNATTSTRRHGCHHHTFLSVDTHPTPHSILSVIIDNVVSWNPKRTNGFPLGFFLRYPLSYGMPSIAC
jgi:hypothetical protein